MRGILVLVLLLSLGCLNRQEPEPPMKSLNQLLKD
jgi:hypothetical protein